MWDIVKHVDKAEYKWYSYINNNNTFILETNINLKKEFKNSSISDTFYVE